jgi:hypothetical protein
MCETKDYTGRMSLNRFIVLWTHPGYPPDRVSEEALEAAERRLQTRLPTDYRNAVLECGLPRPNIELLNTIVDRQLDLRDVSGFLGPREVASETEEWRDLGSPEGLVAFATDCVGNLFCFPTEADAASEVPVFYFDHDLGTVEVIAQSFTRWIDEFCGVAPH